MTKSTKDTFGYLGTEPLAVREQLEQLAAALEDMAKAESAEAIKAARESARRLAREAADLVDDVAGKAGQRRNELEGQIRARPWLAVSLAAAAGFLLASLVRR
jgi:ElaB/YqjD/DUF883 family membrane-anchored ribosome-binding protein